jgi:hypothetical protein
MNLEPVLSQYAFVPAIGVGITAASLILLEEWRLRITVLALQYVLVTWLITSSIPASIAVVKLISGWLACAIMVISARNSRWGRIKSRAPQTLPDNPAFKLIALLIVTIAAFGLSRTNWIMVPEISDPEILGSTLMLGLGLLQLGLSTGTLRVGLGLMTLLSGFEIAYIVVEPSLVVLALIGSVHIGFALVISYLMLGIGTPEESMGIGQ